MFMMAILWLWSARVRVIRVIRVIKVWVIRVIRSGVIGMELSVMSEDGSQTAGTSSLRHGANAAVFPAAALAVRRFCIVNFRCVLPAFS